MNTRRSSLVGSALFWLIRGGFQLLRLSWKGVGILRHWTLNVLFIGAVALVASYFMAPYFHSLAPGSALVINLQGHLVEQSAPNPDTLLSRQLEQNGHSQEIVLRDLLQMLHSAAQDRSISQVILHLDDLHTNGLAVLHEVATALDHVRSQHKKVIAWSSHYDQRQYYLAAHADEVDLDPMGSVDFQGFGRYRNYYREALDKLGIKIHLIRAGTFKSFGEPYILNAPSPASIEAESYLLDDLWHRYTQETENQRKLPTGSIQHAIEQFPELMVQAGGDTAELALKQNWVDHLMTESQFRAARIREVGADPGKHDFHQIDDYDYLERVSASHHKPALAVIVAQGEIKDGEAPAGSIGGRTLARLIRSVREDARIKALVLRIDSPGGSAEASEQIRRELQLTREAGKPVIASLSNLAASGGYWIALGASTVIADPSSITGSIGVFALIPSAEGLMNRIGVHPGGVTTSWRSDAENPLRALDPRMQQLAQSQVDHIYTQFIQYTAQARNENLDKIKAVAQGRVWSGTQALERQLVDRLGNFQDALDLARQQARLAPNAEIEYLDPDPQGLAYWLGLLQTASRWSHAPIWQRIIQSLIMASAPLDSSLLQGVPALDFLRPSPWTPWSKSWLEAWSRNDFTTSWAHAQAHCLCVSP